MKKNIHPFYRSVIYRDTSGKGFSFLTRSTASTKETAVWEDGETYPLIKVEISSASHPVFTGQEELIDTQGRVERFKKKYQYTAENS